MDQITARDPRADFMAVYSNTIKRDGAASMLYWLENNGSFEAPASSKHSPGHPKTGALENTYLQTKRPCAILQRNPTGGGDYVPAIFDMLIALDGQSIIRQAKHSDPAMEDEVRQWVGLPVSAIPKAVWDWNQRTLCWKDSLLEFEQVSLPPYSSILLLRKESLREQLMEAALDNIADGIQLYGADRSIQFFNASSKRLLDIPQEDSVEGQHLLDIFAVDTEYSSTLTALRTGMPVLHRFDCYKSTTGRDLTTVTSAWPVTRPDGTLLGSVTLERDIHILRQLLPDLQQVQQLLTRHLSQAQAGEKSTRYTLNDLVGSSPQLLAAVDLAKRMAPKDINILIQGETGTGKEIFAQGIHRLSSRRNEKFVAINCAAFPETLIEGMLFGTTKGAFTGSTDKAGLIEEANHGTLFLDELNSMSLPMQAKLLRVLQEGTLQRLGSTKYIPVDVRVISSCNEDAYAISENGKLRKDLFYRLASVVIEIPPLRERTEELDELVWHYIRENEALTAQPIRQITPVFWERLRQHSWPGNVRELFHILSYAVSVARQGTLQEDDLPAYFLRHIGERQAQPAPDPNPLVQSGFQKGLSRMVQDYERQVLKQAYLQCGKNATKTAQLLQISRQSFQYYVKKYGLNRNEE